jgi:hypothetical protein
VRNGNGAAPPEFILPDELVKAKRLREAAREELTAATDFVVQLRRNANAAQMAFTAAKDKIIYIAREICTAEGKAVFQERAESQHNTWRLDDQCAALAGYWPGGAPLPVGDPRPLTRDRFDADRRPGMPFQQEHYRALWEEYFARLLNDPNAQWEWRPPRPEDHKMMIPRITSPSFKPRSLEAFERMEAEQAAAERQPLSAFTEAQAELASQAHRRQLAQLEAEQEAAARQQREG